jgi:uncharacterized membrane protein
VSGTELAARKRRLGSDSLIDRLASTISATSLARPARGVFLVWVGSLALVLFAAAWWVLSLDWHVQHPDLGFYQAMGEAVARGQVPYRDFDPAYPPAAIPILVLPSLLGAKEGIWESYALRFEQLALLLGVLLVITVVLALGALHASRGRTILAAAFVAVSPILVGSIMPARYDLWPAALTVGGVAAVIAGRTRLGGAVLGVAVIAKVYPLVILPLAFTHVWRRWSGRAALMFTAFALASAALIAVPFLLIAPAGLWQSVRDLVARPLQVESLGAAILWAGHAVAGIPIAVATSFGSDNLVGPLPDAVATIQSIALVLALLGIWAWFVRAPGSDEQRLVTASAAAVCAFILFGKILSGQYLIWLVPLVALMKGNRAILAAIVLSAALVLMQQWYPARYPAWLVGADPGVSWIVLARDLTLAAALIVLVAPQASIAPAMGRLPVRWAQSATSRSTLQQARLDGVKPAAVQPAYQAYLGLPGTAKKE